MNKGEKKNKVIISNSSINCYGSRVLTSGIDITQYERNSLLLWMHRRGDVGSVVGSVINLAIEGDNVVGELVFDGIGETSKLVKEKWEAGTLKMVSANLEVMELSDEPEYILPGQRAYTVTRSKLIEVSVVDIGGNDDALVMLQREGKSIALSNNDEGEQLPLLILSGKKIDHKLNNKIKMKEIALKLGLAETATEQEVLKAIEDAQAHEPKVKVLEDQMAAIELAGITSMVEGAITARKIGADKKEHFVQLGQKVGAETLKLTFDSMSATMKPTDVTGKEVKLGAPATGEYKKLSEVPADKIMELRKDDKETYMRLYKAEYGMECDLK